MYTSIKEKFKAQYECFVILFFKIYEVFLKLKFIYYAR